MTNRVAIIKTRCLFLALLLGVVVPRVHTQNLVPNGSFLDYNECPEALNQVDRAMGWSRFRGSPDYFNRSNAVGLGGPPDQMLGVPLNAVGRQEPATGDAYVGALLWSYNPVGGQSREHFGAELIEPLQPGVPVYVSFKVSPTTGGALEDMYWTANRAGLRFTTTPYLENGLSPLSDYAVVSMTSPPTDTSSWYLVSSTYVPDSAYQYVVLGNFFSDAQTILMMLNPNGTGQSAYTYFDDVCVSLFAEDCEVGSGIAEQGYGVMRAYPLPFVERCTVAFERSHAVLVELELVDQLGRSAWTGELIPGQRVLDIHVPSLTSGTHTLRAIVPMGALRPIVITSVSP